MKVKLVRDKIEARNDSETVRRVSTPEGRHALLCLKMFEEAAEVADDATNPEEYADLMEVILCLMRLNGVSRLDVETAMAKKRGEKGGFEAGLVLRRLETALRPGTPPTEAGSASRP